MSRSLAEKPGRVLWAVFGLCGFVVAQPLFDVLGRGSTFFAAHQAGRTEVVLFAFVVLFLPAAVLGGLLLAAYKLFPRSWSAVVPVTLGLLTALALVPHIDRAFRLSTWIFLLSVVTVWIASSTAYRRVAGAQGFARSTGFAPLFFAALFLFSSPVSTLVLPHATAGAALSSSTTDVVLVVLDELPLGALLNRAGQIDGKRFPGFSRLARESTWYRNTTTITPWTSLAVPTILTGATPVLGQPPVEANYPRNLFRMLAASHARYSYESYTSLCSGECGRGGADPKSMYRDATTVFLHSLLPDGLASRWLPQIGDRWKDFHKVPSMDEWAEKIDRPEGKPDRAENFRAFLGSIKRPAAGQRPGLWVGHFILPHLPANHLPDGRKYDDDSSMPPGLSAEDALTWSDQRPLVELARQRFVLQIKFVDNLISELLDRLSREGMIDNTLLVVTSDHGLSFAPGSAQRGNLLTEMAAVDVLPIPLFLKYPGEAGGAVDDHPRQILDITPTIAEQLGVIPHDDWPFEGRSLRSESAGERRWLHEDGGIKPPRDVDLMAAASGYLQQFGEGRTDHDVYAFGPFAGLVGRRIEAVELDETGTTPPPKVRLLTRRLADFDPRLPLVPALAHFDLEWGGPPSGDWLAVAVNGTVAGVGATYVQDGSTLAMAMVDPDTLRPGSNQIDVYVIAPDGRLLPTL